MGRKRKSHLISNDDNISVIDLTDVYEIEHDASLTISTRDLPAPIISLIDVYNELVDHGQNSLPNTRKVAGRVTEAAKKLNKFAKLFQDGKKSPRAPCDFCSVTHRECDLERPMCGQCWSRSRHSWVYQADLLSLSEELQHETTDLAEQPAMEEVEFEVLDLDSDDDKENKIDRKEEEFEVEAILGQRRIDPGGTQYLVK